MSNPFLQVHLLPSYGFGHFIQWKIDPVFVDAEPHVFTLQASGTPGFTEIEYEIPAGNAFSAIDNKNLKQAFTLDIFYRVKLETGDGYTYYSKTVAFIASRYTRREYVMAREINRKELLRMTKYTGTAVYLLKKKIHGTVLNDPTIDPVTGVPLTDQRTGHGSQFNVGYYDPLVCYISFEDQQKERKMSPDGLGMLDINRQAMRAIGFPIIETYDIIVEPLNDQRYIVKHKDEFVFPGTDLLVVQTLETELIPNSDPIYQFPVPELLHDHDKL